MKIPASSKKPESLDPAQAFLDRVSPFGAALSEEDSRHHQQLLRNSGQVHGTGEELLKPPGPRFAPLAYKTKA